MSKVHKVLSYCKLKYLGHRQPYLTVHVLSLNKVWHEEKKRKRRRIQESGEKAGPLQIQSSKVRYFTRKVWYIFSYSVYLLTLPSLDRSYFILEIHQGTPYFGTHRKNA